MQLMRSFASDNNSGIHPHILNAIQKANRDHCIAYGDDPYTESAIKIFKNVLGENTEIFFVFTGTGANVLGLKAAADSFHAIICSETAHLNMDECGAPENFTGLKLLTIPTKDGKLFPFHIAPFLEAVGNEHHSQPAVVSITQATELGTVYRTEEIKALSEFAHKNNMYLHMDGARICNAAAFLGCSLKDITHDSGVDVLSFGGTKNGMMIGEAVVFFNKNLARNFKYIRKQGMQLGSKMRFISAQFIAFFEEELWLKNARHANNMARLLAEKLECIPGCNITQKVEANAIFLKIPEQAVEEIRKRFFFYIWDKKGPVIRLMTSFDTTEQDINTFISALKTIMTKL